MSVIESIGARYIPVIADPVEWNSATAYERLTIVQHLGDTYVSKIDVPAGVQITNETYWIRFATFNAQYESLRSRIEQNSSNIDSMQDDITELQTDVDNATDITTADLVLNNVTIGQLKRINHVVYVHIYYNLTYALTGQTSIIIPAGFRPLNRIDVTNGYLRLTVDPSRLDLLIPYAEANHIISIDFCYIGE